MEYYIFVIAILALIIITTHLLSRIASRDRRISILLKTAVDRQGHIDSLHRVIDGECRKSEALRIKSAGAVKIVAERERQTAELNWNAPHDDAYVNGELAIAAACYAAVSAGEPIYRKVVSISGRGPEYSFVDPWPWDYFDNRDIFKATGNVVPSKADRINHTIRCLSKAGALIAAEIDRLIRKGFD